MERRADPIYSKLADDPSLGDAVDAFVVSLAERVDTLQDLDSQANYAELGAQAAELSLDGTKVGFDSLSRIADAVVACASEGDRNDTHKALIELTEIARRIRLGHRGSV